AAARAAALVLFLPPVSGAIDGIAAMGTSPASGGIAHVGLVSPAAAQPAALTPSQSEALNAYNSALSRFKAVLNERRAQINARQPLPTLPGKALYLARTGVIGAYKDLTDALPSKIASPNKFVIPPAYFDADNEPLIDEYLALFNVM